MKILRLISFAFLWSTIHCAIGPTVEEIAHWEFHVRYAIERAFKHFLLDLEDELYFYTGKLFGKYSII